jgi:hypothetical protein
MGQCATGERVDEIEGDQTKKATFFLLPPPETCMLISENINVFDFFPFFQ